MPAFPKPKFRYEYDPAVEIQALRAHKLCATLLRGGRLLLATWNIANLDLQQRRDQDHQLIAEVLSWFDVIALQEVRDNFAPLEDIKRSLGESYALLFSDTAGNGERMAFLYNRRKATPGSIG